MKEKLSTSEEEAELKPIDKFLNEVGYGPRQIYIYFISLLVILSDSAEISILSLCLKGITDEFQLSHFQRSLFGSVIFVGLMMGAFLAHFSDKFGRKKILQFSSFLVFFFGFLTSISNNFIILLFFRLIVGSGIGIGYVISYIYCSEISPIYNRGRYLNYMNIAFPLGEIFVMLLCYFLLSNCSNWRIVIFLTGIPGLFAFILLFYAEESPRFLINKFEYEDSFKILEKFGTQKNLKLSPKDREQIINSSKEQVINNQNVVLNYSYLFSEEYSQITKKIWFLWISLSFIFYGFIYIIPQILIKINKETHSEDSNIFLELITNNLLVLLEPFVTGYITELKHFGRINTLSIFFLIISVSSFMCMFIRNSFFFVLISFVKFFTSGSFDVVSIYTAELYHTKIRSIGSSAAGMVTRFGGITAPFILEFVFFYLGISGPFIIFCVLSFLCFCVCRYLKIETNQMPLDRTYI